MCLTLRRSSRHCCGRSSFLPTTTIPSPPMSRPSSVASSTTTMYRPKKRYAAPAPSSRRPRCSPPSTGRSNASSSPGPSRSLVFLLHALPLSLTRVDRLSVNSPPPYRRPSPPYAIHHRRRPPQGPSASSRTTPPTNHTPRSPARRLPPPRQHRVARQYRRSHTLGQAPRPRHQPPRPRPTPQKTAR